MRRLRLARWVQLLFRRPSRPKWLVHLEWGSGELESEMVALEFMPSVGDEIEIEIRNTATDPKRWRIVPQIVVGEVTKVRHLINLDYGNKPGPDSYQSATVSVKRV